MEGNSIKSTTKNKWLFVQLSVSRILATDNLDYKDEKIVSNSLLRGIKYFIAFLKLIYFWFCHLISFNKTDISSLEHIFLSSNEGHDIKNYLKYISPKKPISLDAFNMPSFYKLSYSPSLTRIIKLLFEAIEECEVVFKSVNNKPVLSNSIYSESLNIIANHVYMVALIEMIKEINRDISFYHCGAVLLSTAINRVDMKSIYLTHGFIGRISDISFPDYEKVYVYSKEEKEHIESITKRKNVILYPIRPLRHLSKKIIIFTRQLDKDMTNSNLLHLIDYFIENNFEVILKPHPSYKGNIINNISQTRRVRVVEKHQDAGELIQEEKPLFSAGWYSTSLCEALRYESVPISLTNEDDDLSSKHALSEIVYPLNRRALSWENEHDFISKVLNNKIATEECLKTLKSR